MHISEGVKKESKCLNTMLPVTELKLKNHTNLKIISSQQTRPNVQRHRAMRVDDEANRSVRHTTRFYRR